MTGAQLLALPVCVRGIELGRPVDVIVDARQSRALGLDVRCRDDTHRFLPFAVATVSDAAIEIDSPLVLLDFDEVVFYRQRASTLRALRGSALEGGIVEDFVLDSGGEVTHLVIGRGLANERLPLNGRALPLAEGRRLA